MFKKLFGADKGGSVPPSQPGGAAANKTINTIQSLQDHEDQLEKRKALLEKRMAGEVEKARACLNQKKKDQAMQVGVATYYHWGCVLWLGGWQGGEQGRACVRACVGTSLAGASHTCLLALRGSPEAAAVACMRAQETEPSQEEHSLPSSPTPPHVRSA